MSSVRTFNSDAPRMPYLEGEAVMGEEDMPSLEYVYPEDLTNAEFQEDVGDDAMQVYTRYWEMLKSGQ